MILKFVQNFAEYWQLILAVAAMTFLVFLAARHQVKNRWRWSARYCSLGDEGGNQENLSSCLVSPPRMAQRGQPS